MKSLRIKRKFNNNQLIINDNTTYKFWNVSLFGYQHVDRMVVFGDQRGVPMQGPNARGFAFLWSIGSFSLIIKEYLIVYVMILIHSHYIFLHILHNFI